MIELRDAVVDRQLDVRFGVAVILVFEFAKAEGTLQSAARDRVEARDAEVQSRDELCAADRAAKAKERGPELGLFDAELGSAAVDRVQLDLRIDTEAAENELASWARGR
jgi:hypothetical protein